MFSFSTITVPRGLVASLHCRLRLCDLKPPPGPGSWERPRPVCQARSRARFPLPRRPAPWEFEFCGSRRLGSSVPGSWWKAPADRGVGRGPRGVCSLCPLHSPRSGRGHPLGALGPLRLWVLRPPSPLLSPPKDSNGVLLVSDPTCSQSSGRLEPAHTS